MSQRRHCTHPRQRPSRLAAVFVALLVLLMAASVEAKRTNRKAARHFAQGKKHFAGARFEEAASSFQQAYAVDPAPVFLFNIGKCREKQGRYLPAIDSYRAYLAQKPRARNRRDVEITIRYLEEKLAVTHGRLKVVSQPPGALVYLDGSAEPTGTTPYEGWHPRELHRVRLALANHVPVLREVDMMGGGTVTVDVELVTEDTPGRIVLVGAIERAEVFIDKKSMGHTPDKTEVVVPAGSHAVEVVRAGYLAVLAAVQVGPGEAVEVQLKWEPEAPTAPTPPPATTSRGLAPWSAWALAGVAVAAGVGGYGAHLAAGSSAEEARALSAKRGSDAEEWQTKVDATEQRQLLSWIGFGVAGAAIVGATVLTVLHRVDANTDAGAPEPSTEGDSAEISLQVLPTLGGATLQFRF